MQILLTGGRGFIGLAAAHALRSRGHIVRLLSSTQAGTAHGFPVVRGDVRDPASLRPAAEGVEAAVLAHQFPGFPVERPRERQTFQAVDADGTKNVLSALRAYGDLQHVVYLSGAAVGEQFAGQHPGIDAKLAAEEHVQTSGVPWTILRASIVYGPGDHYFSALAKLIKYAPAVPVLGNGRPLSAPIHVQDLAATVAACFENPAAQNALWDACGPNILSTNATLVLLMQVLGSRRPIVHLPLPLVNAAAALLEPLPHPPLTRGLVAFTQFENVSRGLNAAAPLGLTYRTVDVGVREAYGKAGGIKPPAGKADALPG